MSVEKNPYRHAHIYPQEIECAACEWAAAQDDHDSVVAERDAAHIEIERLRNTQQIDPYGVANRWHDERDAALVELNQHKSALHDMSVDFAVLEQRLDAALAKLDGYRSDHAALMAERNAALAECERLRNIYDVPLGSNEMNDDTTPNEAELLNTIDELNREVGAWRACADQLADALMHYFSEPPKPALVVYEKLKGADS